MHLPATQALLGLGAAVVEYQGLRPEPLRKNCQCLCGCRVKPVVWDLFFTPGCTDEPCRNPNCALWKEVCLRCYRDSHSTYEKAIIALAQR